MVIILCGESTADAVKAGNVGTFWLLLIVQSARTVNVLRILKTSRKMTEGCELPREKRDAAESGPGRAGGAFKFSCWWYERLWKPELL